MINKKNVAFLVIFFLGVIFFAIGIETSNADCLSISYSVFSGWIVGFLCNVHDRESEHEREKKIFKEKYAITKEKEQVNSAIKNINIFIKEYQEIITKINEFVLIEDAEDRKKEFYRVDSEISKILSDSSDLKKDYFNKEEVQLIAKIENEMCNILISFSNIRLFDYSDTQDINKNKTIEEYFKMLNNVSTLNEFITKRFEKLSLLEQKLENLM